MDFSGAKPRVVSERTVLTDGERVPGGTVTEFNAYDINSKGDLVIPVQVDTDELVSAEEVRNSFVSVSIQGAEPAAERYGEMRPKSGKGLYLQNQELGVQRLAFGDETTVEGHEFYHMFGTAAIHGDDVLFTADFAKNKAGGKFGVPTQGVFHMRLGRALSSQGTGVNATLIEQNGFVSQLNLQGKPRGRKPLRSARH